MNEDWLDFVVELQRADVSREDFEREDAVVQLGLPPRRIDVMTSVDGVEAFGPAWSARLVGPLGPLEGVAFLGRDALVANKRATGRPKDLVDLDTLDTPGVGGA